MKTTAEQQRLAECREGGAAWRRWGPYLSERQWGTVREDYSSGGDAWNYFSHDQARSRAYRWGEDGLGGISDDRQILCFALALWNGRDPILKERLFGLTNSEGNHGEDVKEYYFYLDNTPTGLLRTYGATPGRYKPWHGETAAGGLGEAGSVLQGSALYRQGISAAVLRRVFGGGARMIPTPSGVRVWLAVGHTDMQRGMNSLALQVQQALGRDLHCGDLYVFRGRRGDLVKIIWHDGLGMSKP